MRRRSRSLAALLLAAAAACAANPPSSESSAAAVVRDTAANGLFYEASGAGGETVVLIHAFSVDHRMWDREAELLRPRYRVIRYDLRGHGASALPTGPYAAHADLAALLDELGVARAALVGLSAGARVAVDFAVAYPDRVTRVVAAGPAVSGLSPEGGFEWMQPVIAAARAGDTRLAAERWADTPLMAVDDGAAAARLRALVLDNAHLWGIASNPERPLDPPALGRLGEIRVPLLAVVGERDLPGSHAAADTLAARVPGARKVVVSGAGHMVNFAAPDAFGTLLLEFLGGP